MKRVPCSFGRSLAFRPALLTAVVALVVLWLQPAQSYVIPHHAAISVRADQQADTVDPSGAVYFNRHYRSRIHRSSRSARRRRTRLSVNVTAPEGIVAQNEQAVLECEATGPKPSVLYWLKNGERLPQDTSDGLNLVTVDDSDLVKTTDFTLTTVKSKLYIDCASSDDEAEYTCVAVASDHTESASYKLQVSRSPSILAVPNCRSRAKKSLRAAMPARITMWTHNKLVPMGASTVLVCRTQGSNTGITWVHEETQALISDLETDRVHVRDNGDLELKNIQWADMGGYACQAENEIGTDRQVAFLYPYTP